MLYVTRKRPFKVALTCGLLSLVMVLTSGFTQYTTLEKCLDTQPNEIQDCLERSNKHVTISSCYTAVDSLKSDYLKENVREYCFYQISEFPNLRTCVSKAEQFTDADNHDAALFSCQAQFEEKIKRRTCLQMSKRFRFPEKGKYLADHCDSLN